MREGIERAVNVTLGITANALGEMAHARVLVDEGLVSGHKQLRLDPLEDGSDVLAGEEVVLGEDSAGAGDGAVLAGINAGHIAINAGDPLVTATSLGSVLGYADRPIRLLASAGVNVDGLDGDGDGRVRNHTDEARLSNFAARVRRVHADERLLDTEIGGGPRGGDLYVPSHDLETDNLVGGRSESAVDNPVADHEGGHDEGVGCLAVGHWGQLNPKDIYTEETTYKTLLGAPDPGSNGRFDVGHRVSFADRGTHMGNPEYAQTLGLLSSDTMNGYE